MSTIYVNGSIGRTFQSVSDKDQRITENGETSYIRRGWILSAYLAGLPAEGDDYNEDTTYSLRRISSIPASDAPGFHDVTLTYKKLNPNNGASWDTSIIEKDSSPIPVAVSVYDALIPSSLTAQRNAAQDAGNLTMEIGGVSYQYTTYVSTFTWSASALLKASTGEVVGETGTPTGITSVITDTWKFKGMSVMEKGEITRVTENWEGSTVPFK
jgi:hypothetical protein